MARKRLKDTSIPPTAATRVSSPNRAPAPMATSATAIRAPITEAAPVRCPSRLPIGLVWVAPMSWAWIDTGLELLKKSGLASFWRPA